MKILKTDRIRGYRPDTAVFMQILKKRVKTPFSKKNRFDCEIRWAALYCTLNEFTSRQIIRMSDGIHHGNIGKFFKHYGIDRRKADLIVK